MNKKLVALAAGAALWAAPALAGTVSVSGTTIDGPTFRGPASLTTLSMFYYRHYDPITFSVDAAGSYQLDLVSLSNYDPTLILYHGAFDPDAPLTNIIGYNDDIAGVPYSLNSRITANLAAGDAYIAVVTGYQNSSAGPFTFTISGPGSIALAGAVPEPATWAMMIGGFGLVGGALRRRSATHATA